MQDGNDEINGSTDSHSLFIDGYLLYKMIGPPEADWCVATAYGAANHQPNAKIAGDNVRKVFAGQTVNLDDASFLYIMG